MRDMIHHLSHKRRTGLLLAGVLVVAVSAGWLSTPAAPPDGPGKRDRAVIITVSRLMDTEHLSKHPLDNEISQRAMKTLLDSFDSRKMYFYQEDVDEFMQRRDDLDDEVRSGRGRFARQVYERFMQRLAERVTLVEKLADAEFDFTRKEQLLTDVDEMEYARDPAEAGARWRKLIKYNLLTYKADGIETDEARQKIKRRYASLAKRWGQTDSDELLERYLSAVTTSYDPHTSYMSPSTLENFRILMRLNLEGIGAALQVSEDGYTKVTKVIPGGAADKHGKLQPDDRIVSVGQDFAGAMVDVVDMKLNDVVKKIRGAAGTIVRLGVQPGGLGETKIYSITRAKIELEDSAARQVILQRGTKPDGRPIQIGVIDLPSFYMDMEAARDNGGRGEFRSTTRDVRGILGTFTEKKVDVVVLDLRRNGGGSLTEAINMTGLFIDHGPVVQVKDSAGGIQSYDDLDRGMAWNGPLVVLTSKLSASASEILAGAIQDYRRGLVVGDEATHGKGTVQSLLDLGSQLFRISNPPNLGALKITMQQFYRPNGDSTQKRGVLPDIVLPSRTNLRLGESELDYAIDFDKVDPAPFATYNLVAANTITEIRARSDARVQQSAEFAKELERIKRYQKYKDEKAIPLNEEEFLARRDVEKEAEEEEEKLFEEQSGEKEEVFQDDFYNREVVDITLDYLKALWNSKLASVN